MSSPVSGEHHERAVEAASWEETMDLGRIGSEAARVVIDAYLASLAEQGVCLVDLQRVVTWVRADAGITRRAAQRDDLVPELALADALGRRFGSVSE